MLVNQKHAPIMEVSLHPSHTIIAKIGILHALKIVEVQHAKPKHVPMLQVSHSITQIARIGYQHAQSIQVVQLAFKRLAQILQV